MQSLALQTTSAAAKVDFTNCLPAEAADVLALAKAIARDYHESADATIWRDVFCNDCGTNTCLFGSALELARQAYANGWAMDFKNPVCPSCTEFDAPVSDDDVRADLYYDQLMDK